jgi:hypothetical protein
MNEAAEAGERAVRWAMWERAICRAVVYSSASFLAGRLIYWAWFGFRVVGR